MTAYLDSGPHDVTSNSSFGLSQLSADASTQMDLTPKKSVPNHSYGSN